MVADLQGRNWRVLVGDVRARLRELPACSVQCCVTSPPYFGLRDYGVDGQIGLENTPAEYLSGMVAVFEEVRRVLRDDGTAWVNLGDSYGNPKPKDLQLIPWRFALAMQAAGWWVRDAIAWTKPAPMPESVRDRCTKAWEPIFMFTKTDRYYFDSEAIKEPGESPEMSTDDYAAALAATSENWYCRVDGPPPVDAKSDNNLTAGKCPPGGRNCRNVWRLSLSPFPESHFAVFPPALPERCIKAGTSERGCCPLCGAPWRRITERTKLRRERPNDLTKRSGEDGTGNHCANTVAGVAVETRGWESTCGCNAGEPVPCAVLDPFSGSGTTGMVATELGRIYVGCELNPNYAAMSARRIESWKYRDAPKAVEPLAGQLTLI